MARTSLTDSIRQSIFTTAARSRAFEEKVFDLIKQGQFKYPLYLSAGEEYIPATLSEYFSCTIPIFAQHRAHSTYLSFGGCIDELIDELLGRASGCCKGMGGSASIQSKSIKMFGHDGLMGTQVPIAVGYAFTTKQPVITICGDAAAEEDYVMSAIAWAGTHKIPVLFVVTDNNLSILTEKKCRRNWEMDSFARSVNVNARNISDDPVEIWNALNSVELPALLNIKTDRLFWHAGAGIDEYTKTDRLLIEQNKIGDLATKIRESAKQEINRIWQKHLEM